MRGFAIEGDLDPAALSSMHVEVEWPPKSGRVIDGARDRPRAVGRPAEARRRLNPAQASFVDRLLQALGRT